VKAARCSASEKASWPACADAFLFLCSGAVNARVVASFIQIRVATIDVEAVSEVHFLRKAFAEEPEAEYSRFWTMPQAMHENEAKDGPGSR
jgi:hypothetical protein